MIGEQSGVSQEASAHDGFGRAQKSSLRAGSTQPFVLVRGARSRSQNRRRAVRMGAKGIQVNPTSTEDSSARKLYLQTIWRHIHANPRESKHRCKKERKPVALKIKSPYILYRPTSM